MTNLIIILITSVLVVYSLADIIISKEFTEWAVKIGGIIIAFFGLVRLYRKDIKEQDAKQAEKEEQHRKIHQEIQHELERVVSARQTCQMLQLENYKKATRGLGYLTAEVKRSNKELTEGLKEMQRELKSDMNSRFDNLTGTIREQNKRIDDLYITQTKNKQS